MRIGIDARMYGAKQGGLGRYIEQLIIELEKLDTNDEFVIFLRSENWNDFTPKNPNFKKVLADIPWYGLAEQLKLPKIIKKEKVDLMHFPHWNIPLSYREPFVVTIHDLILLRHPSRRASTLSPIKYFFKNLMFRIVLRHSVSHSRHIITPSEFTKNDIIQNLKAPTNKITAIPLAPLAKTPPPNEEKIKNFLTLKNITKPFVLYVGVAYPHKNLEILIKAWQKYCQKYGNDYQLVLTGKNNYFYERLKKLPEAEKIVFTDFVSDSELSTLYSKASLYVFPSLYEGFGFPALEAMQYDLPVAASRASCLPEILQNACFYFNPEDINEMSNVIHAALTDMAEREKIRQNARELLPKYSWGKTTKNTLAVYKNMV